MCTVAIHFSEQRSRSLGPLYVLAPCWLWIHTLTLPLVSPMLIAGFISPKKRSLSTSKAQKHVKLHTTRELPRYALLAQPHGSEGFALRCMLCADVSSPTHSPYSPLPCPTPPEKGSSRRRDEGHGRRFPSPRRNHLQAVLRAVPSEPRTTAVLQHCGCVPSSARN